MSAANSLQKIVYLTTTLYLLALVVYAVLRLIYGDSLWLLSFINTFTYVLLLPLVILLPLALLLRIPQSVLQLTPVLVVGIIGLMPYYLPTTITPSSGTALTVLTSNVWGFNQNLSAVENWIRQQDADVVLLQELSLTAAQEKLPGLLALYPYHATYGNYSQIGSNTTLSRYPISEVNQVDLELAANPDIIRMVIDVDGQPVAVYNVHLAYPGGPARVHLPVQNPYLNLMVGYNDRDRNLQVTQLLNYVQTEPYPYILAGDFNLSDHSPTYQQLAAQLHDAFLTAGSGMGKSWPVSVVRDIPGVIPPLVRIDYIWHSEHFQAQQAAVGPQVGSDHLPVVAELVLVSA
jgi:endonuclease/exonuclease/phosphatase family metal-dependent hydrolase